MRFSRNSIRGPGLRGEGRCWQPGCVEKVVGADAHPSIAKVDRMRKRGRGKDYRLSLDARLGGHKVMIRAGYLERIHWLPPRREPFCMIEPHTDGAAAVRPQFRRR